MIGIRSNFMVGPVDTFGDMIFMSTYGGWGPEKPGEGSLLLRHPNNGELFTSFYRNGISAHGKMLTLPVDPKDDP